MNRVYFGVKDNGDVVGQQMGDRTLREISQANVDLSIAPDITITFMRMYLWSSNSKGRITTNGLSKVYV